MNRRQFLRSAAALTLAETLPADVRPKIQFPTAPRDRLAVASYPFRAEFKPGGMDLKQFAKMVPERFQVHGIEPLDEHFHSMETAYLGGLRESFKKAGVHVVNVPVDVHKCLYHPDAAVRQAGVDNGKKWVDAAVTLGSPSIRVHIPGAKGIRPDVKLAGESLAAIAEYGEKKNIVIDLENDDLESEDAFFITQVVDHVHSFWLHALPDFCNSMMRGDERFNYEAVAAMFKRAYNISHVKDSESDNGKVYRIDVARTFGIAKAANFHGYFSMEWEGAEDPYTGTARLIEYSLKNLA
jgi:sugar phosphate isomerase/epimerase